MKCYVQEWHITASCKWAVFNHACYEAWPTLIDKQQFISRNADLENIMEEKKQNNSEFENQQKKIAYCILLNLLHINLTLLSQ